MISHCTLHIYNLGRQTGIGLRDRTFCYILLYLTEYRDALSLPVEGAGMSGTTWNALART